MNDFVKFICSPAFYLSVLFIVICAVLLKLIKKYLIKKVAYTNKDETHKNTFLGVIFNILQYIVILLTVFLVLSVNGVDVGTLVAGLGIVSAIIGLALQDMLKDVIMGINIYNNNFYKVGDVVSYNGENCEVKYFNARVTKLKSLLDNSTYTLNNSQINAIKKVKDTMVVVLNFQFDDDKETIDKAFKNMLPRLDAIHGVSKPIYFGLCNIDLDGVKYGMLLSVPPRQQIILTPYIYSIVYEELRAVGITPQSNDEIKVKNIKDNKTIKTKINKAVNNKATKKKTK